MDLTLIEMNWQALLLGLGTVIILGLTVMTFIGQSPHGRS
jgi:hypothetical protein